MSRTFLLGQVLTVLLLAQVWLVVWNVRVVRRPAARRWSAGAPLLSVLVPARNEEASIATCLEALLAQDYPELRDHRPRRPLHGRHRRDDARPVATRCVRLVRGAELPDGWTGKNWACTQLARARHEATCSASSTPTRTCSPRRCPRTSRRAAGGRPRSRVDAAAHGHRHGRRRRPHADGELRGARTAPGRAHRATGLPAGGSRPRPVHHGHQDGVRRRGRAPRRARTHRRRHAPRPPP